MWSSLTSWGTLAVALSIIITIGIGVLNMNPPNPTIAKIAFSLAGIILLTRLIYWIALELSAPPLKRVIFSFVIFGAVGSLWFLLMSLAGNKKHEIPVPDSPRFILTMLGGNIFVPDQDKSLTGIALKARIRNAGSPSIATDWELIITSPQEKAVMAQLSKPPDRLAVSGETGKIVLSASDFSLEDQASKNALKPGDSPIGGLILFYVRIPKSKVIAPDTILELIVSDYSGRKFSAKQKIGDWLQR
jgi:hypothetical protein